MTAFVVSLIIVIVICLCYSQMSNNEDCSSGSGYAASSSAAKGGLNNPGFLIHTAVEWLGKTDSNGCKFENFATLSYGVRAWYVNLFGKVINGTITNTSQMIDVLTPAGNENSEVARNNYKQHVSRANNWLDLGAAVFDFEANPDWKQASASVRVEALNWGFQNAVQYRYGSGNVPPYFNS